MTQPNVAGNGNQTGDTMHLRYWMAGALLGLVIDGCATVAVPPSPEARNALTPTGKLRVGILLTNPIQVTKDAASGELRGVAIDLGKELARRIGAPFVPVGYPSVAALVESASVGEWDVAFLAMDPTRAKVMDFAAPFMEVEVGYMVLAGSSINTLIDVDQPGVRIAVASKGGPDLFLSSNLKHALLVRSPEIPAAVEMVKSGKADVVASNKPALFSLSERLPGFRILNGRFTTVDYGIATAKGRDAGNAYVRSFIEEAKAAGLVKSSIEKAGLRGVVVASLQ
jgi:polar amino acid transport system substrate-binding protein